MLWSETAWVGSRKEIFVDGRLNERFHYFSGRAEMGDGPV